MVSSIFKSIRDVFLLSELRITSYFSDLTSFQVSRKISVRFPCSSHSLSSVVAAKSVMLQDIDFEMRYFAGMRLVDTAKYHDRSSPPSLSCFHTSNDLNLLFSFLSIENGDNIVSTIYYFSRYLGNCWQRVEYYQLDQENLDSGYNDGYEGGQNNPFNRDRNNGCNDYQDKYCDGFIDGCESTGNTKDICETFTDAALTNSCGRAY